MLDVIPLHSPGQIVLRRELRAEGVTDRQIAALVQRGELHRVRRGAFVDCTVWSHADVAERHALLTRAVVRQAQSDVVVSHISALPEYGCPLWGLPLGFVHLTRRDQRAGRREAGIIQHRGALRPDDVRSVNGLDVTSPTRTALDLTTVANTEQSLVVVNFLIHAGLSTWQDLTARYAAMTTHPNTMHTDLVLRLADPRGRIESVAESRTFFMCWRQGLPAPEPQWVLSDVRGRELARLDFAWPEYGVWLEFDGREKYVKYLREGESVVDAVLREKERESMISELTGWRCIRITWADLQNPARTAARIRAMLGLAR